MAKQVLFIQGAGKGAYKEDELLVRSLRRALGPGYEVHYPKMTAEDDPQYDQWRQQIEEGVATLDEPVILVGHSLGGSYLAKALTEIEIDEAVVGVFLLEAPFWGGEGWRYDGYKRWSFQKIQPPSFQRMPKCSYTTLMTTKSFRSITSHFMQVSCRRRLPKRLIGVVIS